jgi:hypothetical protein
LSYIAFIMLKYIPPIPSFFSTFIMKGYWTFSKAFSASIDHVIFVFVSVYMLYYIYHLEYVEPYLHAYNETNLIMVYDLFDVLLNSVWWYFIENFCVYAH